MDSQPHSVGSPPTIHDLPQKLFSVVLTGQNLNAFPCARREAVNQFHGSRRGDTFGAGQIARRQHRLAPRRSLARHRCIRPVTEHRSFASPSSPAPPRLITGSGHRQRSVSLTSHGIHSELIARPTSPTFAVRHQTFYLQTKQSVCIRTEPLPPVSALVWVGAGLHHPSAACSRLGAASQVGIGADRPAGADSSSDAV